MNDILNQIDHFQIVFGEKGGPMAPWWWMDAVSVWIAVCGLFIWLFGGKIVKPSLAFVGLLMGGGLIGLIGLSFFPTTPIALWFIGGAVVGAVAFFILHRLIMGLLIGLTMALVLPVGVSLMQEQSMPDFTAPIQEIGIQVREKLSEGVRKSESTNIAAIAYSDLKDIIGAGISKTKESFGDWWTGLSGGARAMVSTAAAGGLILGMLIGMALPGLGGMLATACIGWFYILLGTMHLGHSYLPESVMNWVPSSSSGLVWLIAGGTLIGLIIQWRILRQPADE